MAEKNKAGQKVAQIRESRKLSREEIAERCQLTVEEIRHIEEGDMLPSLAPLIKIARALGVRLGTFLDDHDDIGPVISKKGKHPKAVHFSGKEHSQNSDLDFFTLASDKAGRHMEPFIIDINPSSRNNIKPSSHEGEEFIYVLSGSVEVLYGRENYKLEEGDSIYYDSIMTHHVHTGGNAPAKILAVVYAPF